MLKVDYFNPVVDDWDEEAQKEEDRQKNYICNMHLFVITGKMKGVFSIAEAVDSAANRKTVIFAFRANDFDNVQTKSLEAVDNIILKRNGRFMAFNNIGSIADFINEITNT